MMASSVVVSSSSRSRSALESFFTPASVAVIGATEREGSVGRTIFENLVHSSYHGQVFAVHPKRSELLGIKCYPSVAALSEPVDLAVIVTPAATVPGVVRECVDAGARSAIVISAGFKERGAEGVELERLIKTELRRGSMRLVGPNCLGMMNPSIGLNATFAHDLARPGNVAFLSQSGALLTAVLDWSLREQVGFSAIVSTGSMLDVDWGDLISFYGEDPQTKSILLYVESVADARSFLSAAREVTLSKPIIVIKAGRTEAASKAASSHTGAMTGSDDVFDAALRRCGVLRVQSISDLFYMAEVLSKQPRPRGPRLTIVTNAGGPGVLATDALIPEGEAILNAAGIPTFAYPDTAARAFDYMWSYSSHLRALYETPAMTTSGTDSGARLLKAKKLIDRTLATGRTLLTEVESKELLSLYGIPSVPTRVARTADEAVACSAKFGYPAVLKVYSKTITHKTDVGGVELDLPNAAAVRKAFLSIQSSVRSKAGGKAFQGVTVQPMIRLDGYELILGSNVDPVFGPVILFGSGGQLVEVYRDRALALPPLNTTLAQRLMELTKIHKALEGVRGRKAVNMEALKAALVAFSELVVELPRIAEIDINPLVVSSEQLLALDARVVLANPKIKDADLPHSAIRPYPSKYVSHWKIKDGTAVVIRPIRPEDEPLMVGFHESLSEESVYLRYFHMAQLNTRVAHERLIRKCFIDYDREMALVAEVTDPDTGNTCIGAVARLSRAPSAEEAEIGVIVADKFQHQGLGAELIKKLVDIARIEKIKRIVADFHSENSAIRHLAKHGGATVTRTSDATCFRIQLDL